MSVKTEPGRALFTVAGDQLRGEVTACVMSGQRRSRVTFTIDLQLTTTPTSFNPLSLAHSTTTLDPAESRYCQQITARDDEAKVEILRAHYDALRLVVAAAY